MIRSVLVFVAAGIAMSDAQLNSFSRKFLPTPTRKSNFLLPAVQPKLPISPTYSSRSPILEHSGRQFAVLRSESFIAPDGSHYQYLYETENGISAHEQGDLVGTGKDAGISATGGFQYTSPEGVPVQIDYQADANGFQPSGNVLPTPPPIPAAILRAIQYIETHPSQQQPLLTRKY